ncbi:hypothetical protein H8356DRAFT_1361405 [Neocallimastix lanati (nom. inval.)]|nr:hypothetical protein H8356DRAFT_1361405 [Neocallimastix sp. JGI-2020a]
MINCHTSKAKETPYRSTLRDLHGESRAHYRWRPCHPRGAGHCNPLRQGLGNGILKVGKNHEDLILTESFTIPRKKVGSPFFGIETMEAVFHF